MEPEKSKPVPGASMAKKYNLEAMAAYNYDNIDFDFDFGDIDEKKQK